MPLDQAIAFEVGKFLLRAAITKMKTAGKSEEEINQLFFAEVKEFRENPSEILPDV